MTPLHKAVIEGNLDFIASQATSGDARARDSLGFTPKELAQLLGKYDCLRLFGESMPETFSVMKKGQNLVESIPLGAFETYFGVTYRRYLTFAGYDELKAAIANCPYLLHSALIARENHLLTERYRKELETGFIAPLSIRWINEVVGYGAFAESDLQEGDYVGEYAGKVRRLWGVRDQNDYCFHYPTKLWNLRPYAVDAYRQGNLLRFVNHSSTPNLQPLCLVDRGLLHLAFVAAKAIRRGTQIVFDYGPDFWRSKGPPCDLTDSNSENT